ncbi:nickel-dependent hydrogenase large subunit [Oceanirhabdus seepicola]|uniref:Nickel-dependent hydrogenase large subunit n=1 Tax=Oceanirhabdus seepicola TaxID=2828781 RepID=A0A9J6NXD2_9CLOT|nr:nickel-dependent hydrogenase large subunit [Oceanirhabdus seepicola]MCM1988716.1 nickel-dependent hydrogenase large subunit [Oceanirhabdus seepicola]
MSRKITINPVTRISGFLEIEVEILNRKIVDAKSSGMLFRGFETMLQGRDPLDAIYFTQRICGICSTAHSMASSFALENALDVVPNENDKMIRDFIHGCEFIQNHIRHIYQYTFPDFVKGPELHPVYVVSHNDFRIPEKLNKRIAQDYVSSIKYSRMAHEMLAELGGKVPHNHGIFVGGATVNMDISKYMKIKSILQDIKEFVVNTMIEDVEIVGKYYPECFSQGIGYKNLMSYGCFDTYKELERTYVSPKVWINEEEEGFEPDKITENIHYSWYEDGEPNRMKKDGYSWIKAPRYKGKPMEVGPLARMWLGGYYRRGISLMDRTIARAYEAKRIIEIMESLLERIHLEGSKQKIYNIPEKAIGKGLVDTTRGALGHWISIDSKKLGRYTIITPSGWNLSPKDQKGIRGTLEKALIGTEIADINHPVEIGRIVRSFDPCVSCATHVRGDYNSVEMIIG